VAVGAAGALELENRGAAGAGAAIGGAAGAAAGVDGPAALLRGTSGLTGAGWSAGAGTVPRVGLVGSTTGTPRRPAVSGTIVATAAVPAAPTDGETAGAGAAAPPSRAAWFDRATALAARMSSAAPCGAPRTPITTRFCE